jgi:type IV pilus assembly protein PilO
MALDTRDPRVQKSILAGLLVGGILYAFFFTTWLPFTYRAGAARIQALEQEYLRMSMDLNKARQAAENLPFLEREYQLLHRKWEQSRVVLPDEQDMTWCLRTISLLGAQSGVAFTLFRPLPARPQQFHTENPIEIKVIGGYHQIGSFLAEVANLDRIINVSGLEVSARKDATEEIPAEASLIATSYTLGGTGVPPEAVSEADGDGSDKVQGQGKGNDGKKSKGGNGGKAAKDGKATNEAKSAQDGTAPDVKNARKAHSPSDAKKSGNDGGEAKPRQADRPSRTGEGSGE